MARLVLLSEGFTGRTYELKVGKNTVGRVPDNSFEIPESSVSSHHAELTPQGSEVHVKDLGSTNGTFINGERLTEGTLKPGQILRLGTIEMRLETGEAPTQSRKTFDQTRVIPQGVKLDELASARAPLDLNHTTAFTKKSNKATIIFVGGAVVVGLILIVLLLYIVFSGKS